MSRFIHLIADYGHGDPAFSEVVHRLRAEDSGVTVQTTEVAPFSTIATGFWIEQLALHNPAFDDLLVYSNTAPRTETATPDQPDEGGPLCYLELDNGVPVIAVDAGYNLSFIKDRIQTGWTVAVPSDNGQFRSRDVFPHRVVELADGNLESLDEELDLREIPEKPAMTVCHVDGYGNIKTSIRASEFTPERESITIEINSVSREIVLRSGVSGIESGNIAMIPGSTGGEDPYYEVFLRGGSAAAAFRAPSSGDPIRIQES